MRGKKILNILFQGVRLIIIAALLALDLGVLQIEAADFCTNDDSCGVGKICADSKCVEATGCVAKYKRECFDGDVYWFDNCGAAGEKLIDCGNDSLTNEYQCASNANMVQQKVIFRSCDQGQCVERSGWNDLQNCALIGNICKNGSCRAGDAAAPIIYNLLPSGTVTKQSVILSLDTNEKAECRYNYYDTNFGQMPLKLTSSDGVHHFVAANLNNYGEQVFYIRCRDSAGNENLTSSKIIFDYPGKNINKETAKGDTAGPVILESSLSPSGEIDSNTARISLSTNERANCRINNTDVAYESMNQDLAADSNGINHQKSVELSNPGDYVYYARCKDAAGNTSVKSAMIKFIYTESRFGQGNFAVLDKYPSGVVYQKQIALELSTTKFASCSYSIKEGDFETAESFLTEDGLQHVAVVTLGDYGNYNYYARCKDADNAEIFSQITFQFKDPEAGAAKQAAECKEINNGVIDKKCVAGKDCICDPDCSGGDNADPDCPLVLQEQKGGINWLIVSGFALFIIGLIFLIFVARIKKRIGLIPPNEESES